MRTTLDLNDDLMRRVKMRAAETGRTVTKILEEALAEYLVQEEARARQTFKLRWVTVHGRVQPGVDLTDRDALYERMEGRR